MSKINDLQKLYANDDDGLCQTIKKIYDRIEKEGLNPIWISIVPREDTIERVNELLRIKKEDRMKYPLYGIPFAVKDNIDVKNLPTTAGCPRFARGLAKESAPVVIKLEEAGAILIGKTNMDQFATGLVGTRSPYGSCSSVFNRNFISGGSSSGSAVAVASQLVTFSLGTDTAGSGRVPAMMNNLIGLKPSRGLLSTRGVVPACRSLDCVSIFAETIVDAELVFSLARGFDEMDPYSRSMSSSSPSSPWIFGSTFRFGVPNIDTRQFFGDNENPILFQKSIDQISEHLGGQSIEFDLQPFLDVANLLYKGPWVAERYAAVGQFIEEHENEVDPVVGSIIKKSKNYFASDLFNAQYELERLKKQIDLLWEKIDLIIVPTAPRTYTIEQINSSPIEYNSHLGYYTNFVNLLDLCAISIPAGFRSDGLPFAITIISHAFTDIALLLLGNRIINLSKTSNYLINETNFSSLNCLLIGVVGAHLQGQPLNYQLTQRKGRFVRTARTNNHYRLYALKDSVPPKPGLLRITQPNGSAIEIEIWALPNHSVSSFIQLIPSPLSIGNIDLDDGQVVKGFLVEGSAVENALDITHLGGWRNYLQQLPSFF